jgi:uncharacterized protein YecT (DUF1311 family)
MRRIVSKLIFWSLLSSVGAFNASAQRDPCPHSFAVSSNTEMRECYTKAQIDMNKRADEIAARIAKNLHTISPKDKALYGYVIVQSLEDAAQKIGSSQIHWRAYRDDYCNAIGSSYTTGSGAGTAYEQCLYNSATARVHQLLDDFPGQAGTKKVHSHR